MAARRTFGVCPNFARRRKQGDDEPPPPPVEANVNPFLNSLSSSLALSVSFSETRSVVVLSVDAVVVVFDELRTTHR